MKARFTLLSVVIMMVTSALLFQGCQNNGTNQQTVQTVQQDTVATVQPQQILALGPVEFIGPISWNSGNWDPNLKNEIQELAKVTDFGKLAHAPEGEITRILKALEINGIYSNSETQTVIWYEYRTPEGKSLNNLGLPLTSKILIQGSWKNEEIEDMRSSLNHQRECCEPKTRCKPILFGGCFSEAPECAPVERQCKETQNKPGECIPCQQQNGYTPGKKQGSGAVPEVQADGTNSIIISDW